MAIAYVVHELPERLRIRLPEHRNEEDFFRGLAEKIQQLDGIETVHVDALTTSVLIEHRTATETLKSLLSTTSIGLELEPLPSRSRYSLAPVIAIFTALNQRLRGASGGSTDLQALLFLILVAIAIRQILKGQIMVPAMSLLWYAFELALRYKSDE